MGEKERADDLITLVVHNLDHALKLKEILEFHGICVTLEDVDCEGLPLQVSPKKVRIPISKLPLGLKILESGDNTAAPLALAKMTGMGNTLLIPVDFSPMSLAAVKLGFLLAEKFNVEPVVLHAFTSPSYIGENSESFYSVDYADEIIDDTAQADRLKRIASQELLKFKKIIVEEQESGELPSIKFSTSLLEGIPEQVIQEYCKTNNPVVVVMATRGIHKKGIDLIGSVTAEVIDACRVPIVTVPENFAPSGLMHSKRVAVFCTFTGYDSLVLRWLMRTFDYPSAKFYLVAAGDRPVLRSDSKLAQLCDYFAKTYPTASFTVSNQLSAGFDTRVSELIENEKIDLMIVPNKKSSAISRFFKPTLAHRILFEKDIPLIVLPVQ